MATVDISKTEAPVRYSPESFERALKTAYSHGLETIYTLETVDIKTVRLISSSESEPKKKIAKSFQKENGIEDCQLEFDFGEQWRTWIQPFLLREPIQVLELTKRAEGCLIANGKLLLGDLIGQEIQEFVFLKGMGQGHIDEIHNKLKDYVSGSSLKRSYHIEFISWLLSLTAGIDRKKCAVYFEQFNFSDLLPLSPAEKFELSRMDHATKNAWIREVIFELRKNERVGRVHRDMKKIASAFVIPWLVQRFGIATEGEIMERLQSIADDSQKASRAIKLLKEVYYHSQFPLNEYLYQIDSKVFCMNEGVAIAYQEIIKEALSYFYNPSVFYSFSQLIHLLSRAFAKSWKNHSENFIAAALRRAPCFRVRKGSSGQLEVRLA